MSHVLIVGRHLSVLVDYIIKHGHTCTLLQDINLPTPSNKKDINCVLTDFADKKSILRAVDQLDEHIDCVLVTYEKYVLPAAWINEHLNLPGIPAVVAEACTDKYLMRSLFDKVPEKISPAFTEIHNESDVRTFAEKHGFPVIIKPANLAKSLLVTKSSSMEELVYNYERSVELLQKTYKKYAPNRNPKLIIEEFMEGSIHSVDAFVLGNGTPIILDPIVDYKTGYDIGYNDNFHYSRTLPTQLSINDQKLLRHCAKIGIKALGMKNSPAHVEIIMSVDGPRIVEIGARNGGYRERMHRTANGIDITGAALCIALGETPHVAATKNDPCAVLELFPYKSGTFMNISNFDQLMRLRSLEYISVKAKVGDYIGKAADGYKMAAVVVLHSSNKNQFDKDLAYVTDHCHVTVS